MGTDWFHVEGPSSPLGHVEMPRCAIMTPGKNHCIEIIEEPELEGKNRWTRVRMEHLR